MINILRLSVILSLIANSIQFFDFSVQVNPLFNNWNCVGIKNNINTKKPYSFNVGELPLVLWNDDNGNLFSTINICKHMGSTLDKGCIKNGKLQCPYHGLKYDSTDKIGETIEQDGKIFWSYKPYIKKPHSIPFANNKNYNKMYLEIDMDSSLLDCAYNSMDLYHPEYVHNSVFGFGNSIPPDNIKSHNYINNLIHGLSFEYHSNKLMNVVNKNMTVSNNFHMYLYPSFTWSKVSFDNNKKHLIIGVNFLPIKNNKTRWYVSIYHNYMNANSFQIEFVKNMARTILFQDFQQMRLQAPENVLKKSIMFNHIFDTDTISPKMRKTFSNYKYPDIDDCTVLYNDYKKFI
jgi:phenylpropionate dioxygenase-like ring-hydroxylating dioxygenase large terminal subunit